MTLLLTVCKAHAIDSNVCKREFNGNNNLVVAYFIVEPSVSWEVYDDSLQSDSRLACSCYDRHM